MTSLVGLGLVVFFVATKSCINYVLETIILSLNCVGHGDSCIALNVRRALDHPDMPW